MPRVSSSWPGMVKQKRKEKEKEKGNKREENGKEERGVGCIVFRHCDIICDQYSPMTSVDII